MIQEKFGNRDVMPSPCDDCAFRDGSPERAMFRQWDAMLEQFRMGLPFFCHKGMPVNEAGEYVPESHPSGIPIEARVCGGWMECHKGEKPWPPPIHILRSRSLDEIDPPTQEATPC